MIYREYFECLRGLFDAYNFSENVVEIRLKGNCVEKHFDGDSFVLLNSPDYDANYPNYVYIASKEDAEGFLFLKESI